MKKFALLFLIILLSQTAFAQRTRPRASKKNSLAARNLANEKTELDAAVAQTDKAERINSLRKFIADFPKSKEKVRVSELLVSTLAALADEKIQAGEIDDGIELFKLAVAAVPNPVSDKLFTEVLLQIPNFLLMLGQAAAAGEISRLVEAKSDGNAQQTLALAGFYLTLENASEAKRLAIKSLALKPDLPAAHQTLGLAARLNFSLEEAVAAYQKALELDANSVISKRSLAEMKRAVGKPSEAVALYREILAKNETDEAARTGLILALFGEENKPEAENEMAKSLEANPNNLPLLVGAAYWYAAHDDSAKAVELAEKAVGIEPRYTWAHIALARGLTAQKRPLDAEKTLLTARNFGNFPTLEYELAAVRMQSGFYREAAEGLAKSFTIKDGSIETKLGGRVSKDAKGFIELLSFERRASIFEPLAADVPENADKLKSLLDFYQKLQTAPNDAAIAAKADEFIKGDDKMRLHRQLFAAGLMLNKQSNLPKVLELAKTAVGGVDAGLSVANPAAAVLAEELYESRQLAITRGEIILVPNVSRQTLSNILRGRIEDLAGWALFKEGKPADAVVRLKRAVSILPNKSSWWRDSQWRLGSALEFDGKSKDALDAYIKSYTSGEPSAAKYSVVQAVYQKVNGSTDGLESRIGEKPASPTANMPVETEAAVAQSTVTEMPKTEPAADVEPTSETVANQPKLFPPSPVEVKTPPEVAPTEPITAKNDTLTPSESVVEPAKIEPAKTEVNLEDPAPSTETKPSETAPVEVKNESQSETDETKIGVSPEPDPVKSEPVKIETEMTPTTAVEPAQKPIFEPIIITVPKAETKLPRKPTEENGEGRPRVVITAEAAPVLIPPCKILVNQESASIIRDGGNLALIAELIGDGEIKSVKASSSSPTDVEAVFDSEIGGQAKRALFIVRSISQRKGVFTVNFEMPCGKKDVSVSVR